MKKVLLLSLSLALGFSAFAQQRVAKNDIRVAKASMKKSVVGKDFGTVSAQPADFAPQTAKSAVVNRFQNMDYASTMWTNYDLQSNQFVANRMYELPDGSVGVVATMSHESNLTASDRGTGYNFYKDGAWQFDDLDAMERVEPFKTGWPSIAQWGENGEILLAHGNNHLQCFTREVAGEGEWVDMGPLPDCPADYPYAEYATWPRVITSGDNHNSPFKQHQIMFEIYLALKGTFVIGISRTNFQMTTYIIPGMHQFFDFVPPCQRSQL